MANKHVKRFNFPCNQSNAKIQFFNYLVDQRHKRRQGNRYSHPTNENVHWYIISGGRYNKIYEKPLKKSIYPDPAMLFLRKNETTFQRHTYGVSNQNIVILKNWKKFINKGFGVYAISIIEQYIAIQMMMLFIYLYGIFS